MTSLTEQIRECQFAYDLAAYSADADMDRADWLWTELCRLKAERNRTLTPAQIRATYRQVGRR